jgi:hypothetical protein
MWRLPRDQGKWKPADAKLRLSAVSMQAFGCAKPVIDSLPDFVRGCVGFV